MANLSRLMQKGEHVAIYCRIGIGRTLAFKLGDGRNQLIVQLDFFARSRGLLRWHRPYLDEIGLEKSVARIHVVAPDVRQVEEIEGEDDADHVKTHLTTTGSTLGPRSVQNALPPGRTRFIFIL